MTVNGVGGGAAFADREGPPAGTEPDAVERDAAPEEKRCEIEAEVVAFQTGIVGENFARGETEGGAAEGVGLAREEDGGEADAVAAELALERGPGFRGGEEVAAVGDEGEDFVVHAADEVGGAGGEGDDDGVGVFAEEREEPAFEGLLQRSASGHRHDCRCGTHECVRHKTAVANRGQTAAMAMTGV